MDHMRGRIACIGEGMIELSQIDLAAERARIGFAGDTLNTAIYLSRLGASVSYVTRLGLDGFSARMLDMLAAEGIDATLVGRHPTRLPGLYAVELDAAGERSFRYWRESSAARTLFTEGAPGLGDLDGFDVVYLSGITLAILAEPVRDALIDRLAACKAQGATVVFDSNYRPRLWPDAATARAAFDAMWAASSIALPSMDDEEALWPELDEAALLDRLWRLGLREIAMKRGAKGPVLRTADGVRELALPPVGRVVDTTGAGDSFNAGYLAARAGGATSGRGGKTRPSACCGGDRPSGRDPATQPDAAGRLTPRDHQPHHLVIRPSRQDLPDRRRDG